MIIENKYSVPAVSLYWNSIGRVNDVLASLISNEGRSDKTRELEARTFYDNDSVWNNNEY